MLIFSAFACLVTVSRIEVSLYHTTTPLTDIISHDFNKAFYYFH